MSSIPSKYAEIPATTSNGIISKQKIFSAIFIAFIKPTLNLERFDKKRWVS